MWIREFAHNAAANKSLYGVAASEFILAKARALLAQVELIIMRLDLTPL